MRTALLSSLCALLTCLLAACGGGKTDATSPAGSGAATTPPADATTPPAPEPADAPAATGGDQPAAGGDAPKTGDTPAAADTPASGDAPTGGATPAAPDTPAAADAPATPDYAMPSPVGDPAIDRLVAFIQSAKVDRARPAWRESLSAPPEDVPFAAGKAYYWKLATNRGALTVRLRPATAPRHVANLIYLTKLGYYDGLKFHRIIDSFMAQGGCPRGDGSGDPGYSIEGEFTDGIVHDARGQLSTANSGPGTDGSQFFLTFGPAPHLDGRHTIFGAVVDGLGTLGELEAVGSPSGTPTRDVVIESATIEVR